MIDANDLDPLSYTTFDPNLIDWQYNFLHDLYDPDYFKWENGTQKVLLSGSVGSAKTTVAAWIACHWCLSQKNAIVHIGRKALPDLRDTLYKDIAEMLQNDPVLVEGEDYKCYDTTCKVIFPKTKGEIIARTWSDKKYKKVRSLRLCLSIIEEGTENNDEDQEIHTGLLQRLNRIPSYKRNMMLVLTNPDSPTHWLYREYIEKSETDPNTHVYYSLTKDNPFLDKNYIKFLEENLAKPEADRMLRGQWVEIDKSRIYYAYDSSVSFLRDKPYQLDPRLPIDLMMDFNIGEGKPMSWAMGQVIEKRVKGEWIKEFHVFKEFHAETMRTGQLLDEMAEAGAFELPTVRWRIFGDASGKNNDTRSIMSDYEIIEKFLVNYRPKNKRYLEYEMMVPKKNPPLRRRHNTANGVFKNALGKTRFFLYKGCEWVDTGFRLTEPKKGADTIEDDSLAQQHVTTAITYWIDYMIYKYDDPRRSVMRSK